MQNHSYENDFDLHENETACRTHFHMKGFALRFVLKQWHKRTRKWPNDLTLKVTSAQVVETLIFAEKLKLPRKTIIYMFYEVRSEALNCFL